MKKENEKEIEEEAETILVEIGVPFAPDGSPLGIGQEIIMRPEDVYVYTTPDVPGWKFEAACCNNLCYLFNLYDYRGNDNKEAAIGQYIGRACEEAKAIAARQDFNCIVDFKPQITLNGEGFCIVNVNFTIGTLYLN